MKKFEFKKGGIKLPQTTSNTDFSIIQTLPIPALVRIPLKGERDVIGVPIVKVGDKVKEGDVIAKAGDFYFHASISGVVKEIGNLALEEARGQMSVPFIEIHFQGQFINWLESPLEYSKLTKEELVKLIFNKGVINCSSNPFLSLKEILEMSDVTMLIVHCFNEGSYISSYEHLLRERKGFLKEGIHILEAILKPKKTILALNTNTNQEIFQEYDGETVMVEGFYPQADESLILQTITHKKHFDKQKVLEEKIAIIDLATLYSVYHAVIFGKPVIDKIITVDGQLVKNPGNYIIKIGTIIKDMFSDFGIFDEPHKIINGNPLRKNFISHSDYPFNKRIESLLLISESEGLERPVLDCIQCGACEKYCPKGLIPNQIFVNGSYDEILKECILCGICSYVCPSSIALVESFKKNKKEEII
jgi:electron transport complex protein RnfC